MISIIKHYKSLKNIIFHKHFYRMSFFHILHIASMHSSSLRSFSVPIRPRRCDWMKLRFVGTGGAKIYSNTKTTEQGSERS